MPQLSVSRRTIAGRVLLYLPSVFLFVYLILRAKYISLTWDEAYTYFEFVRHPSWLPHDFNYMAANNHLLNTWLMKMSVGMFGSSELALRLPNVIAGGVFFMMLLRFLKDIFSEVKWILPAFLIVALNPYLIDFFSIARGYGIAIGMLMCGVYYTHSFLRSMSRKDLIVSQLFFLLATLAALTFIHVFAAATLFTTVFVFQQAKGSRLKDILFATLIPALSFGLLLFYFVRLQHAGAFFLGKDVHSPLAVFASLGDATVYAAHYPHLIVSLIVLSFYVIPLFALLVLWQKPLVRLNRNAPLLFLLLVFICSFVFPLAQHYLTGSNIVSGRAAIFYIPIALLIISISLYHSGKWARTVMVVSALLFTAHFCYTLNTRSYFDWQEQADVKRAMMALKDQKIKVEEPVFANVISTDLPYDLPINYYRMRLGMTTYSHAERKEFLRTCGIYYLPMEDTVFYAMADIIRYFPETKTALYRLQDPKPPRLRNTFNAWHDFEADSGFAALLTDTLFFGEKGSVAGGRNEYSMIIPVVVPDSLKGVPIAATLSCRVRSETKNTSALLVFTAKTMKGESWMAMHVSEIPEHTDEWSLTGWTRTLPADTREVDVFIWNRGQDPVYLDNVAVRFLSYQP